MIEGSACSCGFKTVSIREGCPKCGKQMSSVKYPDEGIVLSYTRLQIPPNGFAAPLDLVMVEIDDGPKLVCWTDTPLEIDQRVRVLTEEGLLRCRPL